VSTGAHGDGRVVERQNSETAQGLNFRLEEHAFSDVKTMVRKASESAQGSQEAAGASAPPLAHGGSSQVSESTAVGEATSTLVPVAGSKSTPSPSRMSSVKRIFRSDAL